jgi:hypothetical protein
MIKRVEGGGVGLMNPMGRYEAYSGTAPETLFPGNNTPTEVPEAVETPRKGSTSSGGILEMPVSEVSPTNVDGEDLGVLGNGVRPDSPTEMSNMATR